MYPDHVVQRFWRKVQKSNDCWEWQGARANYGHFWAGKHMTAHRMSYELAYGSIPDGLLVLHQCDNPFCVNPAHLFLGTQADNMRDMRNKGRHTVGTASATAKLTADQVRAIRQSYARKEAPQHEIARRYGISQMAVSLIVRFKSYPEVQ